jgi:hypothetical protein
MTFEKLIDQIDDEGGIYDYIQQQCPGPREYGSTKDRALRYLAEIEQACGAKGIDPRTVVHAQPQ